MAYTVRRHECSFSVGILYQLPSTPIPAAYIVKIANIFPFGTENAQYIIFLIFIHLSGTHKRRISHDVIIVNLILLHFRFCNAVEMTCHNIQFVVFISRIADHRRFRLDNQVNILSPDCWGVRRSLKHIPLHPQRVSFTNISVVFQRQKIDVTMDDSLCLAKHFRLAYPECCGGNGDGKVVNLYAVELIDADPDGVDLVEAEERLTVVASADNLVLQAA